MVTIPYSALLFPHRSSNQGSFWLSGDGDDLVLALSYIVKLPQLLYGLLLDLCDVQRLGHDFDQVLLLGDVLLDYLLE